jgi:hypothetical protein
MNIQLTKLICNATVAPSSFNEFVMEAKKSAAQMETLYMLLHTIN